MQEIIEVTTTVLPDHRIEIRHPELAVGREATVRITLDPVRPPRRRFSEIVAGYAGHGLFRTAEEVDDYLKTERDAWDG
jgi:hypothetical protein